MNEQMFAARELVNGWTEKFLDDFTVSCLAGERLEALLDAVATVFAQLIEAQAEIERLKGAIMHTEHHSAYWLHPDDCEPVTPEDWAREVWKILVGIEPPEKATGTVMMALIADAIRAAIAADRTKPRL